MLKQGLSPIVTLNQNHELQSQTQSGGSNNVSDLFNHLVVPNWAFTTPFKRVGGKKINEKEEKEEKEEDDDDFINEDLHSKLLSMVKVEDVKKAKTKANKKTRILRIKNTNNKKTKKNKE